MAAIVQHRSIYQGEDKTFRLTVTEDDGQRKDLTGSTLEFQVKSALGGADPAAIFKSSVNAGEITVLDQTAGVATVGQADIDLVSGDTITPDLLGFYKYDVVLILPGGKRKIIVAPSDFEVQDVVNQA